MSIYLEDEADNVAAAYEEVRSDGNETNWFTIVYEGNKLRLGEKGTAYSELLDQCLDDNRMYAYARFETGDEMSRRAKFAFITWIGPSVGALKKAKVSTDKAFVKKIVIQFGKEILADEKAELKETTVKSILEKAGGANYGTGK